MKSEKYEIEIYVVCGNFAFQRIPYTKIKTIEYKQNETNISFSLDYDGPRSTVSIINVATTRKPQKISETSDIILSSRKPKNKISLEKKNDILSMIESFPDQTEKIFT
jgi:hypothetical protein